MVLKFKEAFQGKRTMQAVILMMLALFWGPQKASAGEMDLKYDRLFYGIGWNGGAAQIYFSMEVKNFHGVDEGFYSRCGGLGIYVSKDNGQNWQHLLNLSCGGDENINSNSEAGWGCYKTETHRGHDGNNSLVAEVCWNVPLDYRNCNLKFKCMGQWSESNGSNMHSIYKEINFSNYYTFEVRSLYWTGDYSLDPDGTINIPYRTGSAKNTDGHTLLYAFIDGSYRREIGDKPINLDGGIYSFKLQDIGMDMLSTFTVQPYNMYSHHNDAWGGTQYTLQSADKRTFYPLPYATDLSGAFDQLNNEISLTWNVENSDHYEGHWAIYRNGQRVGAVDQNESSYTDSGFENGNIEYQVYYELSNWPEGTQIDLLKSNVISVNAKRAIPVLNVNAESQSDRIVFTWNSDGYPQDWGNKFNIYVDDEATPIITIIPTDNQTSFRWEHRSTDRHGQRETSQIDGTNDYYTEEPLSACTPHNYRIEGVIGSSTLSSVTIQKKAVGNGTLFYSFDATKGTYPGKVKLSWHVNAQGSKAAKTYYIERKRAENDQDEWTEIYRTSSTDDYLLYTDDTPLSGVYYEYRVTVIDKCEDGEENTNYIENIGFSQTLGTVSGRVTYGTTGSAVSGANVVVKKLSTDQMTDQFFSLHFTRDLGEAVWQYTDGNYAEKTFADKDFTVQMWINPDELSDSKIVQFKDDECYIGMTQDGKVTFNGQVFNGVTLNTKGYSHLSIIRKGANVTCHIIYIDQKQGITVYDDAITLSSATLPLSSATQMTIGHFKGYIDEFRIWTKALSIREIEENYDHLLVGNEKGLETYWTFDENLRAQFFDYSRNGTVYHQHHGITRTNTEPSTITPKKLELKGKTDVDGNYIIQGVPFMGEGTTYEIIPSLGIHTFSPSKQLRYVSSNSLVHNSTDFTDDSSFPVSGVIRYSNTEYPVEGVHFFVDGQICAKDGQPVTTNANGQFEISVPIGKHYITVQKEGHTFELNGRYPEDPNNTGELAEFFDARKNMEFWDNTLVTVAGRITGGFIEDQKPLGFGLSRNNIGQATIELEVPNYSMNMVKVNSGVVSDYLPNETSELEVKSPVEAVKSTAWRNKGDRNETRIITIKTDPGTGEFAALLPPIDYQVKSIRIESNPTLDLGTLSNIIANDPNDTKTDTLVTKDGELYFEYVAKMIKSYYTDPILEITQVNANGAFGDKEYEYKDKTCKETVQLYTIDGDNVNYTFSHPVFKQANKYKFDVNGYEVYTNYDEAEPVIDKVPLQNVDVVFSNQMGTGQEVVINSELTPEEDQDGDLRSTIPDVITLDDKGYAQYEWQAGLPNITSPFTLYLGATFTHVDKTYSWDGLEGIVTGALPSGNNFVTAGPDLVSMIIRDPGGTGSSAYIEQGETRTTTLTTDVSVSYNREDMTHTEIGFKLIQFSGVGVGAISGIITDNSEISTVDAGFNIEDSYENSQTRTLTTTTTRRISTSAEPEYVGAMGDVFIGKSTNIIFGNARSVSLEKKNGQYGFALKDDYVTDQSFKTEFAYSQNYIINTLIPNIINLRNDILRKGVDQFGSTYTVHPDVDEEDWGNDSIYDYTPVSPIPRGKIISDQVHTYNQMIKSWEQHLRNNEAAKVKAIDERKTFIAKNESFDTGSSIESSVTNTTGNTTSQTGSFKTEFSVEMGTDIEIFSIELNYSTKHVVSETTTVTSETETESSFTTGYTLAEVGDDDALTIDVFNAPDGNGAIFVTRGGQTSGPYEGEQKTQYYEPGKHVISAATMQIEIPRISVENAANRVGSIPAGKSATYMLLLRNDSETQEDCFFDLISIDETNKKGAGLHVNGNELGSGRSVLVPAGGTVRMRLDLEQNSLGDLKYDSIAIVLASQSQSDPTSTWDVIADTVWISAEFVPSSTDVTLRIDNTTVNTSTQGELQLSVRDFDPHYDGLKYIAIQYQGAGETSWRDVRKYFVNSKDIKDSNNEELLPSSGIINYTLNMNSKLYPDRAYKFRALSARAYGSGEVTCVSDEITVTKDMVRPMSMGTPQPSDGILSAGDELSILFNEDIQTGRVKDGNFLITGILNGSKINHQTALSLNNTALAASTDADINLIDKDFTFELFIKPEGAGTILSHGTGTKKMAVGINQDSKMTLTIEGQTYTSGNSVTLNDWDYMIISYDAKEHLINSQMTNAQNDTIILFFNLEVPRYMGNGPLCIGQNMSGAMHELLLWEQVLSLEETAGLSLKSKDPHSRNLIGYWKMDEGEGRTITDYSRNRHMTMEAETWHFENKNKAVVLNGTQYINIPTSNIGISMDNDYAVEMWVKAPAQAGKAQLIQAGKVALYIDESGKLQMTSDDTDIPVQDVMLADNAWHHVALSIIRNGNANIYVDGINRLTVGADKVASTSGDNLFIGVRRIHQNVYPEYVFDRYLTATIDEVRIWHATMNADQIKRQRNMRLTGSEPGLVAYYPFEVNMLDNFGQPITVIADSDLCRTGKPVLINNKVIDASLFTDEAPALHVKPEMENVQYSFIASDNKIVINIDEKMAKIDGTTLNITVRDVSDLNGNLSNSITWSAYVDLNPLKWDNQEIDVTQNVTRQSTLNATLINRGGQQQTWTLSNLPSWLDADIEYGVLMPQSEQPITFTVSPATPIGKYEQTIYVQGNDSINTPLVLNVNVIGNIPEWSVNPYDYESSMNVIGVLVKDNTYMADPDNIMAAFIGDECRGVAKPVYNERYGNYFVTMDIYGSSADMGREVTFRAYDALNGTIYPEVTWDSGIFSFIPLTLAGTYADPSIFNVQDKIEQVTELKAGWNWLSVYVDADDMSVPALFRYIAHNIVAIKSQTGGYKVYEDGMWTGNLGNLSNNEMYAVQVKADCKLRVVGTVPTTPVTVRPGWNWIGYYGRQVATLADALASMDKINGDMVKAQQGIAYWDNNEWSGSLIMMQPGMGYQIMSSALVNKTFSYPSAIVNATRMASTRGVGASPVYDGVFEPVNVRNYPDNAIMAVKITAGNRSLANTQIAVFAGDECRTAAFTDNEGVALLTIPGDDPCLITVKADINNQIVEAPVTLLYQTNAMYGTPNHPIVMDMGTTGIDALNETSGMESVYDLGGRKAENMINDRKEILIINGQKQVVE